MVPITSTCAAEDEEGDEVVIIIVVMSILRDNLITVMILDADTCTTIATAKLIRTGIVGVVEVVREESLTILMEAMVATEAYRPEVLEGDVDTDTGCDSRKVDLVSAT